jgi:nicotinamidase-related amidase
MTNDAPAGPDAVHLCVDMQNLFAPGAPWAAPWMERALPKIVRIAAHAPEHTVFTRFIPPARADEAEGMWRPYYRKWADVTLEKLDPGLLELVSALRGFVPPAAVVDRGVYSAFAGGALHDLLRRRKAQTLIVTGGETDVCVLSTVLSAIDLGYRVILAQGALCSSSDQGHDSVLDLCSQRFDIQIAVQSPEEIVSGWRPGA